MKKIIKTITIILIVGLNYGCSGEEVENTISAITQQPNNSNAQVDNYESDKFKPYGLFTGEVASSGESATAYILIDDETKSYFIFTFERIISGEFSVDSSGVFSSVDAKGFTVDSTSLYNLIWRTAEGDEDFILKYTFDKKNTARWSVDSINSKTSLNFLGDSDVASEITRYQPVPARNNIIANQYKIELSGVLLPAYNLTIDFIEDGSVSGADSDGCVYNGNYTTGNENVNTYLVNLSVASCGLNGEYSGLATVTGVSNSVSSDILVLLNSNTGALAFTATAN
jgi:hypothetical protein